MSAAIRVPPKLQQSRKALADGGKNPLILINLIPLINLMSPVHPLSAIPNILFPHPYPALPNGTPIPKITLNPTIEIMASITTGQISLILTGSSSKK